MSSKASIDRRTSSPRQRASDTTDPDPPNPGALGSGPEPLYRQVRRELLSGLASGQWRIGQRLPTESELAERWGVAISTVRAGISQLVAAGVLSRRQGRGTFVAPYDSTASALRFSNVYDSANRKVSTVRDIARMRRIHGGRAERAALRLAAGASMWHLQGLLRVEGEVIAAIEIFLPTDRFGELRLEDIAPTQNLYAIYQRRCAVTVLRMEERVHARPADDSLAGALGVAAGAPLLFTERIAYTFDDEPVELRRRYFEGTRHHYLYTQDRIE